MLFAYTWLWPDQMVLLLAFIPFKIEIALGWIELAFWAFSFLTGSFAIKVSLVLGLAGFLAFYGREVFDWCVDAVKGLEAPPRLGKPQPLKKLDVSIERLDNHEAYHCNRQ